MTIEERAAAAAELKATGKCNCAQAVLKVFEDKLPVDDETLMKLSAGYAAGMGCMGKQLRSPDWRGYGGGRIDERKGDTENRQGDNAEF